MFKGSDRESDTFLKCPIKSEAEVPNAISCTTTRTLQATWRWDLLLFSKHFFDCNSSSHLNQVIILAALFAAVAANVAYPAPAYPAPAYPAPAYPAPAYPAPAYPAPTYPTPAYPAPAYPAPAYPAAYQKSPEYVSSH